MPCSVAVCCALLSNPTASMPFSIAFYCALLNPTEHNNPPSSMHCCVAEFCSVWMQKRLAVYKIDEDKYISIFMNRDNPYVYIPLMESELDDITPMPSSITWTKWTTMLPIYRNFLWIASTCMVGIVRILCTPFALESQRLCILLLDAKRLTINCNSDVHLYMGLLASLDEWKTSILIHFFMSSTAMLFSIDFPKPHHNRFNAHSFIHAHNGYGFLNSLFPSQTTS